MGLDPTVFSPDSIAADQSTYGDQSFLQTSSYDPNAAATEPQPVATDPSLQDTSSLDSLPPPDIYGDVTNTNNAPTPLQPAVSTGAAATRPLPLDAWSAKNPWLNGTFGKSVMPQTPSTPQFQGNNPLSGLFRAEQNLPQPWRAGIQSAQEQIIPTFAGLGSAALGGAAVGAIAGAPVAEGGGIAPLIGAIVGIGAGILGGALSTQAQDAAMKQILGGDYAAYQLQNQQNAQQYPIETAAGSLIPSLALFKPNPSGLLSASRLAGKLSTMGDMGKIVSEVKNPANTEALQNMFFVAFGGSQAAVSAFQQVQQGDFNPVVTAINAFGNILLTHPRGITGALLDPVTSGFRNAGISQMQAAHADGIQEGQAAAPEFDTPEAQKLAQDINGQITYWTQQRDKAVEAGATQDVNRLNARIQQAQDQMDALRLEAAASPMHPVETSSGLSDAALQPTEGVDPEIAQANITAAIGNLRDQRSQAAQRGEDTTPYDVQIQNLIERTGSLYTPTQALAGNPTTLGFARDMQGPPPPAPVTRDQIPANLNQEIANNPAALMAHDVLEPLGQVHVVGGAIRNLMMGKTIKDLDLTFGGSEQQLRDALQNAVTNDPSGQTSFIRTGEQFPVYRLTTNGSQVEIALHRAENPNDQFSYRQGENIPIEEDLNRRSETVNAIGYERATGQMKFPNLAPQALNDLENHVLNIVAPGAFKGDPVRMLRVVRFISEGLHPTPELEAQAKEDAHLLTDRAIPAERIMSELYRVFSGDNLREALSFMQRTGLLHEIMPEIDNAVEFNQQNRYHSQKLFEHLMGVAQSVKDLQADPEVAIAAFLHDIGKPDTKTIKEDGNASYQGHAEVGAAIARKILSRLKFPNDQIDRITFLIREHMFDKNQVMNRPAAFMNRIAEGTGGMPAEDAAQTVQQRVNDLMDIREADQQNHKESNDGGVQEMKQKLASFQNFTPAPRIKLDLNFNDLVDLGLQNGPQAGKVWDQLKQQVSEGQIPNEANFLLQRAKELSGLDQPRTLGFARVMPQLDVTDPQFQQMVIHPAWQKINGDDGGFTISVIDGSEPTTGYAVSVFPERSAIQPVVKLSTPETMQPFVERNTDLLNQPGRFYGGWRDEHNLAHIDVSEVHQTLADALDAARQHNQKAIYHLDSKTEIPNDAYRSRTAAGGNTEAVGIARAYNMANGLPDFKEHDAVQVNPDNAKAIADYYDKVNPNDPVMKEQVFNQYLNDPFWGPIIDASGIQNYDELLNNAYYALGQESAEQYKYLPIKIDWVSNDPYQNSAEMMADVEKGVLKIYRSAPDQSGVGGFLAEKAPYFDVPYNDLFRAVHDYFGHAEGGFQFGPRGEENAWINHSKMFSPLAKLALTTETRGQNSWVNFFGNHPQLPATERPFADQKSILLPPDMTKSPLEGSRTLGFARTEGVNIGDQVQVPGYRPDQPYIGKVVRVGLKNSDVEITVRTGQYAGTKRVRTYRNEELQGYDPNRPSGIAGKATIININGQRYELPAGMKASEFIKQIQQGGDNGIQQETAGQSQEASGSSQGSQDSQGQQASTTGQANQISGPTSTLNFPSEEAFLEAGSPEGDGSSATGEPSSTTPTGNATGGPADATTTATDNSGNASGPRAGSIYPDASTDAARPTAGTAADATANGNATASTDAAAAPNGTTGNGASITGDTTETGSPSNAGIAGRANTAATSAGRYLESLGPEYAQAAKEIGVENTPISDAPQIKPVVPVDQFTYETGKADPATVVLDDRAVPPALPPDNGLNVLKSAEDFLRSKGINIPSIPANITDTPRLLAVTLKGWAGRNWYENSIGFVNSLHYENLAQGDIVKGLMAAGGENQSVDDNVRHMIVYTSRIESGLLGNNLADRNMLMDLGIIKKDGQNRLNLSNLQSVTQGGDAQSRKVVQYQDSQSSTPVGRAAIDKWMSRLFFNRDTLVSESAGQAKALAYTEGRIRYIAEMLGIPTRQAQAAMWVGYKSLIGDHLDLLRDQLAKVGDTESQRMVGELNKIRSALVNGGDISTIANDRFGLKPGDSIPHIPADHVLGMYKDDIVKLVKQGGAVYNYLKGGPLKNNDVVRADAQIMQAFARNPKMRDDLATVYERYYKNTPDVPAGMVAAYRDFGPAAEAIAFRAYVAKNPKAAMDAAKSVAQEMLFGTDKALQTTAPVRILERFASQADLTSYVPEVQDAVRNLDPYGLHDINFDSKTGDIAYWDEARPDQVNINPTRAQLSGIWQVIGGNMYESLKSSASKLDTRASAYFKKVADGFQTATNKDALLHIVAHEVIHGMTYRMLGITRLADSPKALWEQMPKEWWANAVKQGMAREVEAVINDQTGKTLNEWLSGKGEKAGKTRVTMDLQLAAEHLMEHLDYQIMQHYDVPLSSYSFANDEVFRRNVYDRTTAEQGAQIAGEWYKARLQDPEVSSRFAAEADARSRRGADLGNAQRTPQPAGAAAFLRYGSTRTDADRDTGGRGNPAASDQAGLRQEPRTPKVAAQYAARAIPLPRVRNATAIASKLARNPSESDAAYAERVVQKTGVYDSLDTARQILQASRDGFYEPVVKPDGSVYAKVNGKEYKGLASEQVRSWHGDFTNIVEGRFGKIVANSDAAEPSPQSPTGLDVNDLADSFEEGPQVDFTTGKVSVPVGGASGRPEAPQGSQQASSVDAEIAAHVSVIEKQMKDALAKVDQEKETVKAAYPKTFAQVIKARKGLIRQQHQDRIAVVKQFGADFLKQAAHPPVTFEAVDEVVPPAALTPEDAKVQRDVNQQHMERNFEHEVMRQDQPMFDPEIGDTQTMSDVAAAKEEAQTEKEVAAESAPQPVVPVDATPLEKTQVQFRSQQEELSQKLNDFDQSLRRAATAGHEDVKVLTGQMDGLVNQIMKSFDFTHGEKAPQEWWNNVSRQIDAIGVQYDRIGQSITDLVGGEEANARIGAAVDVSSEANRQAQLVNLDDRERAIADVLHHYYQTTGMLGKRMNVLKSLMEHFLPHVIERGPNGNKIQSITSGRLSDNTMHAIARVVDKDTGEILYKTIQELQKRLNEVGDGAVVKTDLGQIFAAHGKGLTQAMLLRQFVTRAATDLEAQVHSNGFQARPVATRAYLRRLPPEIAKFYREVKMGPMVKVLQPDQFGGHPQYLVYSPLAERMERLASSYDMGGKVVSVAQKLNTMNSWFKQYKFVSPMHAWSMMSNLQVQSGGKLGLLGVPGVVDPKVWGLMHNGNKIYKDSLMLNRAVASGWTKPDMNVPENMQGPNDWMHKIPLAGSYFKALHWWMWQKVGYEGGLGLWNHLRSNMLTEYAKNVGKIVDENGMPLRGHEDEVFMIEKMAADHARRAVGFLNDLDMTKDWDLYGNTLFLANKWTTGQLRALGEAAGIKYLANIGGGERYINSNTPQLDKYLTNKSVAMARTLVIGGMMRLAATSMLLGTGISSLLNNGVPSTPIQNYMRDPMHTFDIYAGRDPQTNRDRWIHYPFYLFQREMTDWALTAVKAHNEGQSQDTQLLAPLAQFAAKVNPASRWALEMIMNREIGRWMKGYGNPDISSDKYIQNIQQSLDNMGIPTFGAIGPRIIYTIRTFAPSLNYPVNLANPTSDTGQLAASLGVGTFNPFYTFGNGQASTAASNFVQGSFLGTRESMGNEYVQTANGEAPLYQVVQQSNERKALAVQMAQAAAKGDWSTVESIRQQAGFTPGQMKQYILFGATSGGTAGTSDKGLVYSTPPDPFAPPAAGKPTLLFGQPLDPQQTVVFNNIKSQREEKAIQLLLNDPAWKTYNDTQKQQVSSTALAFADKITDEQVGQALGRRPGTPISNANADAMLQEAYALDQNTMSAVKASSIYQQADPTTQAAMLAERSNASRTAVYDKYFGTLKGATDAQLTSMVNLQMSLHDMVRSILPNLPTYQNALNEYDQSVQMSEAMTWVDGLSKNAMSGLTQKNMDSPLTRQQLTTVVQNGLYLQGAALDALHQSPVYNSLSPTEQQAYDKKYMNLARNVAMYDSRDNIPVKPQDGSLYQGGFARAIQTQIVADSGYQQLVETYFPSGGTDELKQHQADLARLKAEFAQEQMIPPSQMSKYDTRITNWYYQNNPNYAAYVKAYSIWKSRTPVGQAYDALSKGELNFAANSPLSMFAPNMGQ